MVLFSALFLEQIGRSAHREVLQDTAILPVLNEVVLLGIAHIIQFVRELSK